MQTIYQIFVSKAQPLLYLFIDMVSVPEMLMAFTAVHHVCKHIRLIARAAIAITEYQTLAQIEIALQVFSHSLCCHLTAGVSNNMHSIQFSALSVDFDSCGNLKSMDFLLLDPLPIDDHAVTFNVEYCGAFEFFILFRLTLILCLLVSRVHLTCCLYDGTYRLMAYADRGKQIHCFSCRPIDTVRCHLGYIVLEVRGEALVLLKSQLTVQGIESRLPESGRIPPAKAYLDVLTSWSTNEYAIDYTAAGAYALAWFAKADPGIKAEDLKLAREFPPLENK